MYTYIIRSVRHTIHTAISCVQCKHVIYNTFILSLIAHNESPWPEIQPLLHRMLSHFPPYKNSFTYAHFVQAGTGPTLTWEICIIYIWLSHMMQFKVQLTLGVAHKVAGSHVLLQFWLAAMKECVHIYSAHDIIQFYYALPVCVDVCEKHSQFDNNIIQFT